MNLIVITHEIENESFLINELEEIATNFDKVFVITTEKNIPLKTRYATIVSNKRDFFISSVVYSITKLFSKEFRQELRDRKRMRVSPSLKRLISSCITTWMIEKRLTRYLNEIWTGEEIVLYSYWLNTYAYFVAKIKKKHHQIRAISRAHGFEIRDYYHYIPFRHTIDSNLDKIVFISRYTCTEYNRIMAFRTTKRRAEQKIIYLGIRNNLCFYPKSVDNSTLNIVSCSGIYPLKRLDLIIDGLAEISQKCKIVWTHFGTGIDHENVFEYAKKTLNDSNILFEFKGQLPNSEILNFYRENQVDLFINTSDYEGIPVSIMEAMSFGIPCIARNVGGNREIIKDNVSGKLLPEQVSPTNIASALYSFYLLKSVDSKKYLELRELTYDFWAANFNAITNYRIFSEYILSAKSDD